MNPSTFSRALTNVQRFALFTAALCLAATTSCAADANQTGSSAQATQSQRTSSDLDNIGFIKNPPKALTDRFPMCDAFLNVEWIDKEKMIGYTHYEAQTYNVHGKLSRKKKSVWALVKLDDNWPSYSIDVYSYIQKGRRKELFDLVKNGKEIGNDFVFQIKYNGEVSVFYKLSPVLSDHRQTVCLAYPDEQRAWIVEAADVKHAYNTAQQKLLLNRVIETWASFEPERLANLWVLDINFDGKNDFINSGLKILEYTWKDKLYSNDVLVKDPSYSIRYSNYLLTFPPDNHTCRIKIEGIFPLTTDGKSYYIRECNITEPTALPDKE